MERVTFLIEATGQRLGCLLNPTTLELTRSAGIRRRQGASGVIASRGWSDDPLLSVGGGVTELKTDLLFDLSVAGSNVKSRDVRDLTRPLWDLTESHTPLEGGRPPVVQFFWGKRESFPAVVLAVAERLEHFTSEGVPQRSWLRLRMARIARPSGPDDRAATDPLDGLRSDAVVTGARTGEGDDIVMGPLAGGAGAQDEASEARPAGVSRLDTVAAMYFGDASLWRWIADYNGVDDPARMGSDRQLRLPPEAPEDEGRR